MKKILPVLVLCLSISANAQTCKDVGISNQAVLLTLLKDKSVELINVTDLAIDSKNKTVVYKNDGSLEKIVRYESCGYQLTFSDPKDL